MFKLVLLIVFVGLVQHALVAPTIDQKIVNHLREQDTVNVILTMKDETTDLLITLQYQQFPNRVARLNAVADALRDFATKSQKNVIAVLNKEQEGQTYEILWITNQIFIRRANMNLVQKLSAMNEISTISEDRSFPLDEPFDLEVYDNLPAAEDDVIQWGVLQIEAPKVWAQNNTGQDIVIATCDTGVRGTHEALRNNFVGEYGWFDPEARSPVPIDGNGHGTHTTGNIAGQVRNIGVAPGSKWMACRGCSSSACWQSDLLACAQFFVCPTKPDGTDPDCSKAPHLVSNSWGGGQGTIWYYPAVEAYRAAGIIPLFSIGNSGPSCGSANSPGDYDNLIGVGSTTSTNELSYFSSVGPTTDNRMKPDIAAPGSDVFSAYHTGDDAYASMSGTSMACPHAAGVVALLLQANPTLDYDQVLTSMRGGGVPITSTGRNCGEVPEEQYPNHHSGSGRVNAVKTIETMHSLFGNK